MTLTQKVLARDETTRDIVALKRNVRALISSKNKLTPELAELRDIITASHWELESLLSSRLTEALYVTTRPKYFNDGKKLSQRFSVFQVPFSQLLSKLNFRDLCDLASDWGTISEETYKGLLAFNRYRNSFTHADMAKVSLFKDPERRKNLLELTQNLLITL
jgi:hypothetical protein